ncbi:MAG: hypothetical protein MRZ79_12135 [Bacteroidia bacterium]|nr:hypothetical protein [Bacteroidia bacterium]
MRKIHFYSGLLMSLFVGAHIFNHLMVLGGIENHIHWMEMFRNMYRNPIVETLLLLAVGSQVYSGWRLFKGRTKGKRNFFEQIHILSGLYLAVFFIIHISAVMAGRFILHVDTNYYFATEGLRTFPANLFFLPYYSTALLSFFGLLAAIHYKKMSFSLLGVNPFFQACLILGMGLVVSFLVIYGLMTAV